MRRPYFRAHPIALRKYLGNCESRRDAWTSKHALPSCLGQEGFAIPRLDGPVRDGYANVVKASTSDLGKILLGLRSSMSINTEMYPDRTYNESFIVIFELVKTSAGRILCHSLT